MLRNVGASALLTMVASCSCNRSLCGEIGRTESGVGMVSTVTWEANGEVQAQVEFGPADDCARFQTSSASGTSGAFDLIGLGPSVEACFEIVVSADGDTERCGQERYTTGPPPQGIAVPDVTINEGGDEPFLIMSLILPPAQIAIDRSGEVVWANVLDADRQTTDIHLNTAGDGFNFNDYAADHSVDDSYARFVGYDGSAQREIRTVNGHHAYELFDDGRIAFLAIDLRTADYIDKNGDPANGPVVGDVLIEQQPDGTTREVWNAWNDLERMPIVEDGDSGSFFPQGLDWTHADFFFYDAARHSYVISMRNINTVLEVAEADGSWMRSVGEFGEYGITDYPDWETIIGHPHNANVLADSHWLFLTMPNHGADDSQILEFAFDDAAKTASIVWSFEDGKDAKVEGAGERLPNGNTLINWGAAGTIQEVTPDETIVWEAVFGVGSFAGHVHAVNSFHAVP